MSGVLTGRLLLYSRFPNYTLKRSSSHIKLFFTSVHKVLFSNMNVIGIIQTQSSNDKKKNFEICKNYIEKASEDGAKVN